MRIDSIPSALLNDLVIDLARETYDLFVMGGWEPQDAHLKIRLRVLRFLDEINK
jgi:hypothetical protein